MTRKRRTTAGRKTQLIYKTPNRQALADTNVKRLIKTLKRSWVHMPVIERGERLRELVSLGCSTLGLERVLDCSATSVRRHIVLAELPEEDRKAIAGGASAKKILMQKADTFRRKRQLERVIEDRKTGIFSDEIATMMLEFCREGKELEGVQLGLAYVPMLFELTENYLNHFDARCIRPGRISKRLTLQEFFRATRPQKKEGEFWAEHHGRWLAIVVLTQALERPIWESALKKAANRIGELKETKTPIKIWEENVVRLLEISTPSVRPVYGGAKSLPRQGRPTPPGIRS